MVERFVDVSREDSIHAFKYSDFICNIVKKIWIPWTSKQINNVRYDELAF